MPTKRWKLSPMDLESRKHWADYSRAKDEMFATPTPSSRRGSWSNADDKKCARLNCIRHLLSVVPYQDLQLDEIKLAPRPSDAATFGRRCEQPDVRAGGLPLTRSGPEPEPGPGPVAAAEGDERAGDTGRLLALSDGVFAITMTLLVLDIRITPGLSLAGLRHALGALDDTVVAAGLTFAVAARFWVGHHWIFDRVRGRDTHLLWLNLLFLATIVALPFASAVLSDYGNTTLGVQVYAVTLTAGVLTELAIWIYAVRRRLVVSGIKPEEAQRRTSGIAAAALIFIASGFIAIGSPAAAKYFWVLAILPGHWIVPRRLSALVVR